MAGPGKGDGDDRREESPDEVQCSLGDQPDHPVWSRHERVDRHPVELLDPPGRQGVLEDVHRDPDDLAFLLAQTGDVVDP
jgi:hypothetical protein